MKGACGRYLDYSLHFWGLGSKRSNVKSSCLIEMQSEIGTSFHILVHHGPNTGEPDLKFAVFIVCNIGKRMDVGQSPLSRLLFALLSFGSIRGNIKSSYSIEIHSEIVTLLHIHVHHGPNAGKIVMKFVVYIVYNISKRMDSSQMPLSRLLLALLEPWKQTR